MRTNPANAVSHRISATSSPASVSRSTVISGLLSRRPRDVVGKAALLVAGLLLALVSACAPAAAPQPTSTKAPEVAPTATAVPKPAAATPTTAAKPSPTAAAAAKPLDPVVKVKVGHNANTGSIGLYIAMERGYFKEEGIDVELVPQPTAAEAIPILVNGQLDFGDGGSAPGHFNAVARGLELKFISDKVTLSPGHSGGGIVVRKDLFDSGTKSMSGLKGKTVAIPGLGGILEMLVDNGLKQAGLRLEDIKLEPVGLPDIMTGLANKSIDAAWTVEPFITIGIGQGILVQILETNDLNPNATMTMLTVSPVLAQKNPEAVRRFVTAHLRGQRDYYDAFIKGKADKEPIISILTKYTPMKDPELYRKQQMLGVHPNGAVDPKMLVRDQDYYSQRGWVPQKVNAEALFDPQYLDYAIKRLGKIE